MYRHCVCNFFNVQKVLSNTYFSQYMKAYIFRSLTKKSCAFSHLGVESFYYISSGAYIEVPCSVSLLRSCVERIWWRNFNITSSPANIVKPLCWIIYLYDFKDFSHILEAMELSSLRCLCIGFPYLVNWVHGVCLSPLLWITKFYF